jgi:hypothetical protein
LTAKQGEQLIACDIFDKKRLSIDGSGTHGSRKRQTFLENLRRFGIAEADVKIHEGSSTDLEASDLTGRRLLRMFSVDGGHTRNVTASDMALTASNLAHGGIVIVDDFYHPDWPGVQEGVHAYFALGQIPLAPFLIAWNKLFLTTPGYHALFLGALEKDPWTSALGAAQKKKMQVEPQYVSAPACFSPPQQLKPLSPKRGTNWELNGYKIFQMGSPSMSYKPVTYETIVRPFSLHHALEDTVQGQ